MKKIYSIIGVILLVGFSFYYTDSAVNIVKRNDPIMKKIVKVSSMYNKDAIDATLVNNNIIPGTTGTKLDIEASYSNMKRLGSFNSNLLEFETTIPTISISNTFDKYVVSGNKAKQKISFIFNVRNTMHIDEILAILEKSNIQATFFLDYNIILNDTNTLKQIQKFKHELAYLGRDNIYEKSELLIATEILTKFNKDNAKYCYSERENKQILDLCKKEHLHTIIPSISTTINPYNDIKPNIENGSIIKLENNNTSTKELKYIINFIKSKGYKIVPLNKLLEE